MGLRCSFWYSIVGKGCLGNRNCQLFLISGLVWWANWFFLLPVLYLLTTVSLATLPRVDFLFVLYFRVLFRKKKWLNQNGIVTYVLHVFQPCCSHEDLPSGQRVSRSEHSWCTVRKGEFTLDFPSPARNVSSGMRLSKHINVFCPICMMFRCMVLFLLDL